MTCSWAREVYKVTRNAQSGLRRQPNGSDALRSRPLPFGPWPSGHQRRIRPRQSVALQSPVPKAATTERGPPNQLQTCAQNARKLRHKGLKRPAAATKWRDALRSRPLPFGPWPSGHQRRIRPRRSAALVCFHYCDRQWLQPNGGTRSVASAMARETATTEHGPPVASAKSGHDGAWPSTSCNMRPRRAHGTPQDTTVDRPSGTP